MPGLVLGRYYFPAVFCSNENVIFTKATIRLMCGYVAMLLILVGKVKMLLILMASQSSCSQDSPIQVPVVRIRTPIHKKDNKIGSHSCIPYMLFHSTSRCLLFFHALGTSIEKSLMDPIANDQLLLLASPFSSVSTTTTTTTTPTTTTSCELFLDPLL